MKFNHFDLHSYAIDETVRGNIGTSQVADNTLGSKGKCQIAILNKYVFPIILQNCNHCAYNVSFLISAYKISNLDRTYYRTQISPYGRPK